MQFTIAYGQLEIRNMQSLLVHELSSCSLATWELLNISVFTLACHFLARKEYIHIVCPLFVASLVLTAERLSQ